MDVRQAEKEITKILSQLEESWSLVVHGLRIDTIDLSNLDESGTVYAKQVVIMHHPSAWFKTKQ